MDGLAAELLRLRSLVGAVAESVERLITAQVGALSEAELLLTATAIQLARTIDPKSLAEGVQWARAYLGGDEAWVLLRSHPKDGATITYFGHLTREQRQILGR